MMYSPFPSRSGRSGCSPVDRPLCTVPPFRVPFSDSALTLTVTPVHVLFAVMSERFIGSCLRPAPLLFTVRGRNSSPFLRFVTPVRRYRPVVPTLRWLLAWHQGQGLRALARVQPSLVGGIVNLCAWEHVSSSLSSWWVPILLCHRHERPQACRVEPPSTWTWPTPSTPWPICSKKRGIGTNLDSCFSHASRWTDLSKVLVAGQEGKLDAARRQTLWNKTIEAVFPRWHDIM
jgi:hypothetical protein